MSSCWGTGTVGDRCRIEIPASEFEAILPHLAAELVNRWNNLDENIVCRRPDGTGPDKGVYVVQSRAVAGNWADEVEGPLRDAFRRAARAVGLPRAVRRKYEASATRRQINAGVFDRPTAPEHVVAFVREMHSAAAETSENREPRTRISAAARAFVPNDLSEVLPKHACSE